MANNTREGGHRKPLRYMKTNRLKYQKTQAIEEEYISELKNRILVGQIGTNLVETQQNSPENSSKLDPDRTRLGVRAVLSMRTITMEDKRQHTKASNSRNRNWNISAKSRDKNLKKKLIGLLDTWGL